MKTENLTLCMLYEIYLPERQYNIVSGDKVLGNKSPGGKPLPARQHKQ